jgi:hypothetical protein|tara:strand:- start:1267 stop:1749 length:483 start_codon:yes stop_codon:yes gene_type:complete
MGSNGVIKMVRGIKMQRSCTHINEDGFRCNKLFMGGSTNSAKTKYCDEHRYKKTSMKTSAGLVASTNVYTKAGNDTKMRDFVYKIMATYEEDKATILQLKKSIESINTKLLDKKSDSEQAAQNLILMNDIERLRRETELHKKKIESMRKMIHNMKKSLGI